MCGETYLSYENFLDEMDLGGMSSQGMSQSMSQQSSEGGNPVLTIDTTGAQVPVNGKIEFGFTASDPDGLFLARLSRSGNAIEDLSISGTNVTDTISTSSYTAGVSAVFVVTVYDVLGNRVKVGEAVIPQAGPNQGPAVNFRVFPPQGAPGESLFFDGFSILDPEFSLAALPYEWQFDEGDAFTSPAASVDTNQSYLAAGKPLVRLRVTDIEGVSTTSAPVALRIGEECGDGIDNDGDGSIDYPVDPGCAGVGSTTESPECDDDIDNDGDNGIDWDGGSGGLFQDRDLDCTDSWTNNEAGGNASPVVVISAPIDLSAVAEGDFVTFTGSATDLEDGDLTANLSWASDLDGAIGTGATFGTNLLSIGVHLITASVIDSGSEVGADAIQITVDPCNGNSVCDLGEICDTCPSDCASGTAPAFCCGDTACDVGEDSCSCSLDCGVPPTSEEPLLTCEDALDNDCDSDTDCDDLDCNEVPACLPICNNDLVCEPVFGEDCNTCPSDCAGQTSGNPTDRYCCGDDVDCDDARCTSGGFICWADTDGDGVSDPEDNCLALANGWGTNHVPNPRANGSYQCDDDLDGYGNLCDCDVNNDGVCDGVDTQLVSDHFGQAIDASNAVYDLDCDGTIGFGDSGQMGILRGGSTKQMGVDDPLLSGLACADPTLTPPGNCPSPAP